MALVASGSVSTSALKRTTGTMPSWTAATIIGFIQIPDYDDGGTPHVQTHLQIGGSGGFLAMRSSSADGFYIYHDWGSWGGSDFLTFTRDRWYAFSMTVGADRVVSIRMKDLVTGTVSTEGGTNPTWASSIAEFWLGNFTYGGTRSWAKFAGWRLFNSKFTEAQVDDEWDSLAAVITSGLLGDWPMDDTASKANNLVDDSGTGNLVETGTAFTVDADLPSLTPPWVDPDYQGSIGATLGLAAATKVNLPAAGSVGVSVALGAGQSYRPRFQAAGSMGVTLGLLAFTTDEGTFAQIGDLSTTVSLSAVTSYYPHFEVAGDIGVALGIDGAPRINYAASGNLGVSLTLPGATTSYRPSFLFAGSIGIGFGINASTSNDGALGMAGELAISLSLEAATSYYPRFVHVGELGIAAAVDSPTAGTPADMSIVGALALNLALESPTSYRTVYAFTGDLSAVLGLSARSLKYVGAGSPHTVVIVADRPTITIARRVPSMTIAARAPSMTIVRRQPVNIHEQTSVTLDVTFRDRDGALNTPASAFYYVVEKESGTKVVDDTQIGALDDEIAITIPHAALKVPSYDGSRSFLAVVVADFGNGDRVPQTHEITADSIPGLA